MRTLILLLLFPVIVYANIFGDDSRRVFKKEQITGSLRNIVNLKVGDSDCTGSFVGDRLILTVAHCLTAGNTSDNDETPVIFPKVFYRKDALSFDATFSVERVWINHWIKDKKKTNDWALILIKENRKDHYFGYAEDDLWNESVTLGGYSDDLKGYLGIDEDCNVRSFQESSGLLLHDCDSTIGASGAPIYRCNSEGKSCKLLAMHIGEFRDGGAKSLLVPNYSNKYANTAISSSEFIPLLKKLREAYNSK